MASNNLLNLQRAYDNYCRILVSCTEVLANPTQGAVDTLVAAAGTAGVIRPKVTYTEDGATYNWMEYQQMVLGQLKVLKQAIQMESEPFEVRTRGLT